MDTLTYPRKHPLPPVYAEAENRRGAMASARIRRTTVSPLFLVRHAAFPTSAARFLSSTTLLDALNALDAARAGLEARAPALGDAIHEVIGQLSKDESRRTEVRGLIELRRCIHNGRLPKSADVVAVGSRNLPAAAAADVAAWHLLAMHLQQIQSSLDAAYETDQRGCQISLLHWYAKPVFRRALQIANGDVERQLEKLLAAQPEAMNRKLRVIENTVFGYFLRACTKTSPFSTFGPVSAGYLTSFPVEDPPHAISPACVTAKVRLNAALLSRIANVIHELKQEQGCLAVRPNPTLEVESGRLFFVRFRSLPLQKLAALSSLNALGTYTLPVDAHVAAALDILARAGTISLAALAVQSAATVPGDLETIKAGLQRLLKLGVLEPAEQYDPADYDSLLNYIQREAAAGGLDAISRFVEIVRAATDQLDTDDVAARRGLIYEINEALSALPRALPALKLDIGDSTILYEDAATIGQEFRLCEPAEADILETARLLQSLQPLFDETTALRAAMVEYFKNRQRGETTCTSVARFCEEFFRECVRPFWISKASSDAGGGPGSRRGVDALSARIVKKLERSRAAVLRLLRREISGPSMERVSIQSAMLHRLADRMPVELHNHYSASLFLQPCETRSGRGNWVLDQVLGGSGQLFSRFLYLYAQGKGNKPAETLRAYLERALPGDAILAEVLGTSDSNLNFHPPIVRHCIATGGSKAPPGVAPVDLRDLRIVYDAASDSLELWSKAPQRRVIPIYLGGLVSHLLPSIQQVLLLFGPAIAVSVPTWQTVSSGKSFKKATRFPRVQVGLLVVMRAMWIVPGEVIPRAGDTETNAGYFHRIQQWRRDQSLPNHVYLRFAQVDDSMPGRGNQRKPTFFDLGSVRSVQALRKELMSHQGDLWMTEALPDPSGTTASAAPAIDRHHCEYVFDISTTQHSPL